MTTPQPLAPARLADVPPRRGVPGAPGRTLAAVQLTLQDINRRVITQILNALGGGSTAGISFGGLRSGSFRAAQRRTRVSDYSYIPGVTVTTPAVSELAKATFTVGGSAGVRGTVRIQGKRLLGRLGGQSVDVADTSGLAGSGGSSAR